MIHLVYSAQALISSDYFKNGNATNIKDDIILMMNSYSCPNEIASKVKSVYTLQNKEQLENKLFELVTKDTLSLRSWY